MVVPSRRGARQTGVALVLAGLALSLLASSAGATFPGKNGRIAFTKAVGKGGNINAVFSVSPSGGKQTRLAANKSYGRETPSYSPDGRRLAFTDQDGIFVASASGRHPRRISHGSGDRDPSFSGPKGKRIAFSRIHMFPSV